MKTSPPRARLYCRLVRQWSTEASAHVAGCADCQRYFAASGTFESALRRDASHLSTEPSVGFEQRLMNAVRRAGPAPARETVHRPSGPWIFGAALAAIACGVFVFQRGPGGTTETQVAAATARADAAVIVDAVESLSNRLVESVIPSAGAIVADNPLQRELDSIYTDARSALGFLAMNFLPAGQAAVPPRSG